jgi:hypothetical protein
MRHRLRRSPRGNVADHPRPVEKSRLDIFAIQVSYRDGITIYTY